MENSSISVVVRVRPFSEKEQSMLPAPAEYTPILFSNDFSSSVRGHGTYTPLPGGRTGGIRKIVNVLDDRILVFDPPETSTVASLQRAIGQPMGKKVKDIRFCFDRVFDEKSQQEEIYEGSAKALVGHVLNGFNSTVFAYGATGCGKTHTISGTPKDPGVVYLTMAHLFESMKAKADEIEFSLTVSYLEIYNETIRDLLCPESGTLSLRESDGRSTVSGLSEKEPRDAHEVVEWIIFGNKNRTVNATEANASSSRSHAVLTATVTQRPKGSGLTDEKSIACLSIIDLAGSERASVTKNKGERLIEGANINRSLLALGNCINALCDPRKRGHVPYRDSKLTRLLKQSLGGNCKTVMIVCISPSSVHYDETHNTLQYANRAKEIKTKAIRNVISADRHVAQYCSQILEQRHLIEDLKRKLAEAEKQVSKGGHGVDLAKERDEDKREAKKWREKLVPSWDAAKDAISRIAKAEVSKAVATVLLQKIQDWERQTIRNVLGEEPSLKKTLQETIERVENIKDLLTRGIERNTKEITTMMVMNDAFTNSLTSLTRSLQAARSTAVLFFQFEANVLQERLESIRNQSKLIALEDSIKLQFQVLGCLDKSLHQVGSVMLSAEEPNRSTLQKLYDSMGEENRMILLSTEDSSMSPSKSPTRKRDQRARSPVKDFFSKATRSSMYGIGSAPTGSLAAPIKPMSVSPVVDAIKPASSPKKKGVQWREDLEEVKELSDAVSFEESFSNESAEKFEELKPAERPASYSSLRGGRPNRASTMRISSLPAVIERGLSAPIPPSTIGSVMETPLRASRTRRDSSLGPQRSAKPNRRFSYLGPPSSALRQSRTQPSAADPPTAARRARPSLSVLPNGTSFQSSLIPEPNKTAARITARRESHAETTLPARDEATERWK